MKKQIAFTIGKLVIFFLLVVLQLPAQIQNKTIVRKKTITQAEYSRWKNYSYKNDFYISAYTGYGSYSMKGMSSYQSELIKSIGIDAQVNSDFPSYWLYGITVMQKYDASRFGFNFEKMSTGARSSISDYSGQFYSDFRCNAYKMGVVFEKDYTRRFRFAEKLVTGYRVELGGLYSEIQNKIYVLIYDAPNGADEQRMTLFSGTYYIEPTLFASYPISKKTVFQLSAGLMLDVPVYLRMYMDDRWGEHKISWAGYRLHLAIVQQL